MSREETEKRSRPVRDSRCQDKRQKKHVSKRHVLSNKETEKERVSERQGLSREDRGGAGQSEISIAK